MFPFRDLLLLPVVAAVALVACEQPTDTGSDSPVAPEAPAREIAHGGDLDSDPSFVFLEPLVKGAKIPETFNPNLALWIDICRIVKDDSDPDNASLWECQADADGTTYLRQFGPADLVVETDRYKREWKLDAAEGPVTVGETYRIIVRAGDLFLGHADVAVLDNMGARNALTGDEIAVNDDRTVVIAFHAGDIGDCDPNLDCVVEAVSPAADDTVYTRDGYALAIFPAGWTTYEVVNVSIVEKPLSEGETCLPQYGDFLQGGSCYTYTTYPDVGEFDELVTVGQCMDEYTERLEAEFGDVLQLSMWADDYTTIQRLPNVDVPLDCTSYLALHDAGWFKRLAHGAFSWLVPPLHASHNGLGGLAGTFSDAGWTLWLDVFAVSGEGQHALPGEPLRDPIVVRYEAVHTTTPDGGVTIDTVRDLRGDQPLVFSAYAAGTTTPYAVDTLFTAALSGEVVYNWTLHDSNGTQALVVRDSLGNSAFITAQAPYLGDYGVDGVTFDPHVDGFTYDPALEGFAALELDYEVLVSSDGAATTLPENTVDVQVTGDGFDQTNSHYLRALDVYPDSTFISGDMLGLLYPVSYSLTATVDPDDLVAESNESDNSLTYSFTVGGSGDGTLRGNVHDWCSKEPISSVTVSVSSVSYTGSALSNSEGDYLLSLTPGEYAMQVGHPEYSAWNWTTGVVSGVATDMTIGIVPENAGNGSIVGKVTYAGTQVEAANVCVRTVEPDLCALTDANGDFAFTGNIPSGLHSVEASKSTVGAVADPGVEVCPSGTAELTLDL